MPAADDEQRAQLTQQQAALERRLRTSQDELDAADAAPDIGGPACDSSCGAQLNLPRPAPPAAPLRTRPSGVRDTCLRLQSPVGVVIAEPSASSSSSSPPLPPKLTRGLQRPVSQLCRAGPAAFEQLYRAVPEMGRRMCSPPPPPPPSKDSDACFRFRVRFRFPLRFLRSLRFSSALRLNCSASQLLCSFSSPLRKDSSTPANGL